MLSVQKYHQQEKKNKGHTLFLFDHQDKEQSAISGLVANPPGWTDEYYGRGRKQLRLDQIIDVPFFGDSKEVLLIQVADLISYILRRYAEIEEGKRSEQFDGERTRLINWVRFVGKRSLPSSTRWPKKALTAADKMFIDLAPKSIHEIGQNCN